MLDVGICLIVCRGYEVDDGKASVALNTAVYGDVTVVVYHARSAFGGKVQGKVCIVIVLWDCIIAMCVQMHLVH